MSTYDATAALRGAGLRVTRPRLGVLEVLDARPHSSADEIAGHARAQLGSLSTQAVYDVLRAAENAGLVRRIEPAGSPAIFELDTADNHHHVVCRTCGRIADVPCATGNAPCLTPDDALGYVVDEAEVVYWGQCPDCTNSHAQPHHAEEAAV